MFFFWNFRCFSILFYFSDDCDHICKYFVWCYQSIHFSIVNVANWKWFSVAKSVSRIPNSTVIQNQFVDKTKSPTLSKSISRRFNWFSILWVWVQVGKILDLKKKEHSDVLMIHTKGLTQKLTAKVLVCCRLGKNQNWWWFFLRCRWELKDIADHNHNKHICANKITCKIFFYITSFYRVIL